MFVHLFNSGTATLGKEAFERIVPASRGESAWSALLRAAPASGRRQIDLVRLAELLRQRRLPDDIKDSDTEGVVISTVHRAKGLEFDVVVLAQPAFWLCDGEKKDEAEEARLLYVGLTRAREQTLRLETKWDWRIVRVRAQNRWGRRGNQRWSRLGLQALYGDVHTEDPAGSIGFQRPPREIQEHLTQHVASGDAVALQRLTAVDDVAPIYVIKHAEEAIGVTSLHFGRALRSWLQVSKTSEVSFPLQITDLRVAGVETVAGSVAAGRRAEVSDLGVWLAPRLVGMGHFVFDKRQDENDA